MMSRYHRFTTCKIISLNYNTWNMGERIRIIATPPGQAPEPIREQWVGLELPVVEDREEPSVQEVESLKT